jgi:hypothetical protein
MAGFTAVAAAASLTATAAGSGASFAQARKQRKLQDQAMEDATKAMNEARKKLDVNFYEQLAIKKLPYELEREATLSSVAQLTEAAREAGPRAVGSNAGRILAVSNEAQGGIRSQMATDMANLEKITAAEDSRLAGVQADLDLDEATGAQLAARDAGEASNLAAMQGISGVTSAIEQGVSMIPLFGKGPSKRYAELVTKAGSTEALKSKLIADNANYSIGGTPIDKKTIEGMDAMKLENFFINYDANELKKLYNELYPSAK